MMPTREVSDLRAAAQAITKYVRHVSECPQVYDNDSGDCACHAGAHIKELRRALHAADAATRPHVTHGRHCTCSACAREDWPSGRFVCGMHGKSCPHEYQPCPHEYQPIGPAGSVVP